MIAREASAEPDTLTVRAQVRPGTYYVGQSIDLFVNVVAGRERPEVTTPRVAGAEVTHVGNDPLKPISAGGIGDVVFERNLFRSRYRLIARRAGTLMVPPITARTGERTGSSDPLSITIRALPEAGRMAEFLGGVGAFEVIASAEPTSIRSGQSLEYRITVKGPSARGTTGAPSLARMEKSPVGFQVERRPDVSSDDPPSRVFVYRLRPIRAGVVTLPPIAVAAFDPVSGRYVTRVTQGITIRVADVPRFQPDSIAYRVPARTPVSRSWTVAAGIAVTVAVALGIWRFRRKSDRRYSRICHDARSRLGCAGNDAERGRIITDALIEYLGATIGRHGGALTPFEAEEGVARSTGSGEDRSRSRVVNDPLRVAGVGTPPPESPADALWGRSTDPGHPRTETRSSESAATTGSDDLARRAGRLVAACDQARFGGGGVDVDDFSDAGLFFSDLASVPPVDRPRDVK